MIYLKITNIKNGAYKMIDATKYNMLDLERTFDAYEATNRFYVKIVRV
jgi:hypothetical protein